jgi:hypothetical protein
MNRAFYNKTDKRLKLTIRELEKDKYWLLKREPLDLVDYRRIVTVISNIKQILSDRLERRA